MRESMQQISGERETPGRRLLVRSWGRPFKPSKSKPPQPNVLEVRFRFGSTPPNFSDLAGSGSVRTELRELYHSRSVTVRVNPICSTGIYSRTLVSAHSTCNFPTETQFPYLRLAVVFFRIGARLGPGGAGIPTVRVSIFSLAK